MSLHISYPRTKLVPTILFTHKKKQPCIIRPNFTNEERQEFLDTLQKISLGKQYDYYRIIQILISTSLFELKKFDDSCTDKIVCSHNIFQALIYSKRRLRPLIYSSSEYEVNSLGTFTITDFVKLANNNPD